MDGGVVHLQMNSYFLSSEMGSEEKKLERGKNVIKDI